MANLQSIFLLQEFSSKRRNMKKYKTKNKFRFWHYFGQEKFKITLYLITSITLVMLDLYSTILLANMIADVTEKAYELALEKLAIFGIVLLIRRAAGIVTTVTFNRLSLNIVNNMRLAVADQAYKIDSKSYASHSTANFTQRIVGDPHTIFSGLDTIVDTILNLTYSIVIVGYIATLNWVVCLIMLVTLIISTTFEILRRNIYKKNSKISLIEREKVGSLLNEVVRSERDIKSLNLESALKNEMAKKNEVYKKAELKTVLTDRYWLNIRHLVCDISAFIIMWFGVKMMSKELLTVASFMVIYSHRGYMERLAWYLGSFLRCFTDIGISLGRINELYQNEEYTQEKFGKTKIKNVQGNIVFDNVGFTYVDKEKTKTTNKKEKPKYEVVNTTKVFENLSFEIEKNTTVAFVGKSGSGKSTILNLMSKMYEVDKGRVLIDGKNINSLNKETIRSSISLVNQFPYIFDMTIKENMLMTNPTASDEEIHKALKDASLDEFVAELKDGIDTRVGESGVKLSGGERQRLAIARALLKNPSIILFDESTSSLDNIAQAKVKQSIDNIQGKSTVVIVAHRLSTIKNADKIFFLDKGQIVDSGTFEQLYKNNKTFKTMFLAENI